MFPITNPNYCLSYVHLAQHLPLVFQNGGQCGGYVRSPTEGLDVVNKVDVSNSVVIFVEALFCKI